MVKKLKWKLKELWRVLTIFPIVPIILNIFVNLLQSLAYKISTLNNQALDNIN